LWAKGYPQFDAAKYEACMEEIKKAQGVTRLGSRESHAAHEYCFKKHRGPVADMISAPAKHNPD